MSFTYSSLKSFPSASYLKKISCDMIPLVDFRLALVHARSNGSRKANHKMFERDASYYFEEKGEDRSFEFSVKEELIPCLLKNGGKHICVGVTMAILGLGMLSPRPSLTPLLQLKNCLVSPSPKGHESRTDSSKRQASLGLRETSILFQLAFGITGSQAYKRASPSSGFQQTRTLSLS